jgi:hypothetical protein
MLFLLLPESCTNIQLGTLLVSLVDVASFIRERPKPRVEEIADHSRMNHAFSCSHVKIAVPLSISQKSCCALKFRLFRGMIRRTHTSKIEEESASFEVDHDVFCSNYGQDRPKNQRIYTRWITLFPMQFKKSPQPIDEEQLAVLAARIVQALDSLSRYWPWLAKKYENRLTPHVCDFLKDISLDPSRRIDLRRCRDLDVPWLQLVHEQSSRDLTTLLHLTHTRDMYFLAIELSIRKIDSNGQQDAMEESTFKDFVKMELTDRRLYVVMLQYVKECDKMFSAILGETRRQRDKGLDICTKIEDLRRR